MSLDAPPYRLLHARNDPLPMQGERMPIWLGVQGEKVGLRMVAELADGWNFDGTKGPDAFRAKLDTLRRHCDDVGRDIRQIEVSVQFRVDVHQLAMARDEALGFIDAGAQHLIFYLDGRQGPAAIDGVIAEVIPAIRERSG